MEKKQYIAIRDQRDPKNPEKGWYSGTGVIRTLTTEQAKPLLEKDKIVEYIPPEPKRMVRLLNHEGKEEEITWGKYLRRRWAGKKGQKNNNNLSNPNMEKLKRHKFVAVSTKGEVIIKYAAFITDEEKWQWEREIKNKIAKDLEQRGDSLSFYKSVEVPMFPEGGNSHPEEKENKITIKEKIKNVEYEISFGEGKTNSEAYRRLKNLETKLYEEAIGKEFVMIEDIKIGRTKLKKGEKVIVLSQDFLPISGIIAYNIRDDRGRNYLIAQTTFISITEETEKSTNEENSNILNPVTKDEVMEVKDWLDKVRKKHNINGDIPDKVVLEELKKETKKRKPKYLACIWCGGDIPKDKPHAQYCSVRCKKNALGQN